MTKDSVLEVLGSILEPDLKKDLVSLDFIESLEKVTGIKAAKKMLPMQPGDVEKTWADTQELTEDFSYKPDSDIDFGVKEFVKWYKEYYQK